MSHDFIKALRIQNLCPEGLLRCKRCPAQQDTVTLTFRPVHPKYQNRHFLVFIVIKCFLWQGSKLHQGTGQTFKMWLRRGGNPWLSQCHHCSDLLLVLGGWRWDRIGREDHKMTKLLWNNKSSQDYDCLENMESNCPICWDILEGAIWWSALQSPRGMRSESNHKKKETSLFDRTESRFPSGFHVRTHPWRRIS